MSKRFFGIGGFTLAIAMSASMTIAQPEPLLGFDFDEGDGAQVTDLSGLHVGVFGLEPGDPIEEAYVTEDSPSGAEGDASVFFTGQDGLRASDADAPFLDALVDGPITAELWVKVEEHTGYADFFRYGQTYKFGFNNGNLVFTHLAIADYNTDHFIEPGEWVHVAAAWEPGVGVTFYVNGEEGNFVPTENLSRAAVDNNLWVGSGVNTGSDNIHAAMSRFRIHNAVLTADELDSVADAPKDPYDSTVVHYTLDSLPAENLAGQPLTAEAYGSIFQENLVAQSMPEWSQDSPTGLEGDYSLYFNGQGARISVPDPNLDFQFWGEEFTLEAYVKYDELPNTRAIIFSYGVPGQGGYSFSVTRDDHAGGDYRVGRKVFVTTYGILDANNNSEIPNDGDWHHIAVVYDVIDFELRFYVNGELADARDYTSGINFTDQRNALYVGIEGHPDSDAAGLPFQGYIDRIRLHDVALSADQFDIVERVSVNHWNL